MLLSFVWEPTGSWKLKHFYKLSYFVQHMHWVRSSCNFIYRRHLREYINPFPLLCLHVTLTESNGLQFLHIVELYHVWVSLILFKWNGGNPKREFIPVVYSSVHWYTTIVYMIYKDKNWCRCLEAEVFCIWMVYRLIYTEKGQNMTHIQQYTFSVYTSVWEQNGPKAQIFLCSSLREFQQQIFWRKWAKTHYFGPNFRLRTRFGSKTYQILNFGQKAQIWILFFLYSYLFIYCIN